MCNFVVQQVDEEKKPNAEKPSSETANLTIIEVENPKHEVCLVDIIGYFINKNIQISMMLLSNALKLKYIFF